MFNRSVFETPHVSMKTGIGLGIALGCLASVAYCYSRCMRLKSRTAVSR